MSCPWTSPWYRAHCSRCWQRIQPHHHASCWYRPCTSCFAKFQLNYFLWGKLLYLKSQEKFKLLTSLYLLQSRNFFMFQFCHWHFHSVSLPQFCKLKEAMQQKSLCAHKASQSGETFQQWHLICPRCYKQNRLSQNSQERSLKVNNS